jgi:hypothetical protein
VVEEMADEIAKQHQPAHHANLPDADAAHAFSEAGLKTIGHVVIRIGGRDGLSTGRPDERSVSKPRTFPARGVWNRKDLLFQRCWYRNQPQHQSEIPHRGRQPTDCNGGGLPRGVDSASRRRICRARSPGRAKRHACRQSVSTYAGSVAGTAQGRLARIYRFVTPRGCCSGRR